MKPLRILWYSNSPSVPSGYGTVTKNVVTRLRAAGLDVWVVDNAHSQLVPATIDGIPILPGGGGLCEAETYQHYREGHFDWLVMLYDSFATPNFIQYSQQDPNFRLIAHVPFDHDMIYPNAQAFLEAARVVLPYSQYGHDLCTKQLGYKAPKLQGPIPHGVDTKTFRPMPEVPRRDLVAGLNALSDPCGEGTQPFQEGDVIVGLIKRNKDLRGMIPEQLEAFRALCDSDPDLPLRLYLHTQARSSDGHDLIGICQLLGIADRVRVVKQYDEFMGIPAERMARAMNACDVGMMATSCLPPGERIFTREGVRPIETIREGDRVLTHTGAYRRVEGTEQSPFDGNLVEVSAAYVPPVRMTPNHPVLRRRGKSLEHPTGTGWEWVRAAQLRVGDLVTFPRPRVQRHEATPRVLDVTRYLQTEHLLDGGQVHSLARNQTRTMWKHPNAPPLPHKLRVTPDLMRLFGYYLAEGVPNAKSGVGFCISQDEKAFEADISRLMRRFFGLTVRRQPGPGKKLVLWYQSKLVAEFFAGLLGHGAHNKAIPPDLFWQSKENLLALLQGCWRGDGSAYRSNERTLYGYTTVSEQLAHQVWAALVRLGFTPALRHNAKRRSWDVTVAGAVEERERFAAAMGLPCRNTVRRRPIHTSRMVFPRPSDILLPIREVNRVPYRGNVFNLHVAVDRTFTSYFAVHNSEGFGLPSLEWAAAGKPVVGSDNTVTRELLAWAPELRVRCLGTYWAFNNMRYWFPDKADMHAKLRAALRGDPEDWRRRGVAFAARYDYDRLVREQWLPFFAGLEGVVTEQCLRIPDPGDKWDALKAPVEVAP